MEPVYSQSVVDDEDRHAQIPGIDPESTLDTIEARETVPTRLPSPRYACVTDSNMPHYVLQTVRRSLASLDTFVEVWREDEQVMQFVWNAHGKRYSLKIDVMSNDIVLTHLYTTGIFGFTDMDILSAAIASTVENRNQQ